jgi:DNA-directed RNA polymerase specialized sigma24 family protein
LEFTKRPEFRELTEIAATIKEELEKVDNSEIERLQKCLKTLKPEDRDLVQRYYNTNKKKKTKIVRKEIEIELNIPNNVLRARIHRIKASLFKCMEKLRRE